VVFVTDTNSWQTARQQQLIDLHRYGAAVFCSNELGKLKADADFFPTLLDLEFFRQRGLKASDTLFIDDSEEKVVRAQEVGIPCIQFRSAMQLEESLTKIGNR
jgi:FMN phosphatase YigB (HAD superfamily)